jgi:hypothetical protein
MWGFAWMFWLVPLLLFLSVTGHWRRRRWEMARSGPGWPPRLEQEMEEQRSYVETLERRVAELEDRLDFTERLLAGRSEAAS